MAEEREVTITIRGKNLSPEAFAAARKDLAGIKGEADKASASSVSLGQAFKGPLTVIATAATATVAALGAIAFAINDLGQRGSDVADVSDQFTVLNTSIGNNAKTLMGTLNTAMAGTISNFDLMQATNKGLSQGLKLSEDQFGLTARGARILSDRIGGDTKTAYETLTMAMATGQDKQLKGIGLNIDAEAAVNKFAAALGKEATELTESETIAAKKNAILAEMQRVLGESGDAEVDFADRVSQGKKMLADFVDQQSESIARSPVLAAGMDSIGKSFAAAFGPNQGKLVDLITAGVNKFAMFVIDAGLYVVELGRVGYQAFGVMQVPIRVVGVALAELVLGASEAMATIAELAAKVPGTGRAFDTAAAGARLMADGLTVVRDASVQSLADARALASGNGVVDQSLQRVSRALQTAKADMVAASLSQGTHTAGARENATANLAVGVALQERTTKTKAQIKAEKEATESQQKFAASMKRLDTAEWFVGFKKPVSELSRELEELPSSANIAINGLARFKDGVNATNLAAQSLGSQIKSGLVDVLATVPGTLARAFEGGGNMLGAAKSIGSQFGSVIGKNIGASFASLGALGGPIGSAIGSLAGPLIGKIAGLFTSKNTQEVKGYNLEIGKVRDSLLATYGPLDQLEAKAQSVGMSFKDAWGHQGQAGMAAMGTLAQEFKKRWDDVNNTLATSRGELDTLIKQGTDLGYTFDANGKLVNVSVDKMRDVAGKFGLDLKALGPSFDQAGLRTRMDDVINGFTLMDKGGTSTGTILSGMKDEINAIVNDSIKFGVDIPANMQPWIAHLIETGQLTDANGVKITDMAAIKFGAPVQTEFEKISSAIVTLIASIQTLVDRIGSIATAAASIPKVPAPWDGWGDPPEFDFSGRGGSERSGTGFARGTFGTTGIDFPDFGSGTRTVLHGRESVVPYVDRVETAKRWLGGAAIAPTVVAAPPVYVVNDFSGARQVSEGEFKQIQARLDGGGLQVPARAITARGR